MALLQLNFESRYLCNNTEVSVILPNLSYPQTPKEFYGSGKKYKVLWLLHGTFGDHSDWVRKSNIELYACERQVAVVMPSGLNADYANWPTFSTGFNMYDYLFEELMPLVYNWLPVSEKPEDNYIAGLSMGGAGTCIYALNHPEKFAGAAVLSAYPWDLQSHIDGPDTPRTHRWKNAIANAGGPEAYLASYQNTRRILTERVAAGEKLPKLYFCCGKDDFLYDGYLEFKAYAKEIGLKAKFEEAAGFTHEWRFWDKYIQRAMDYFGLKAPKKAPPVVPVEKKPEEAKD